MRRRRGGRGATGPIEGYLVGAYCIERELLTWRRLRFPHGVAVGDIVVFPNTAGYLMHILESASHQIPLARNLVLRRAGEPFLDAIDAPLRRAGCGCCRVTTLTLPSALRSRTRRRAGAGLRGRRDRELETAACR